AERIARENERRFRNLVEGSIQAILVHRNGKPLFVNQAYARLVGCEGPDEILALASIDRFIAPNELDRVMRSREALLRNERPSVDYEIRMQRKDGSSFWAYGQTRMVIWNADPAIQVTIIDITDRRMAEEELRQAQKTEAIGQLTGGLAHDFNNLLAVVIGNLELIDDNVESDRDLQETVRVAWRAAQRAVDLTERLLSFARRQPLDPTPTNVNEVILGMESMLSRTLGETIEVVTQRDDELWPVVIDRSYLESAILNLALNSRDAMPDGGKLTIATSNLSFKEPRSVTVPPIPPGDYVTITVTDTGVGMTPDIAERAFEPFFTTKQIGKGTGLGLSMVYGFVRQSNGYVTLDSEVGRGASIRIYLPRGSEYEAPAVTASAEPDDHAKSGVGTILVVEDDPDVQSVVCGMVRYLGYRVLRAADGVSAVHLLETMPAIDIVLTDVVLPGGMLGPEIVRIALSRRPQIDYLYMSAHTYAPTLPDGSAFPTARLIRKPFNRVQLARQLRQLKRGDLPQVEARRSSAGPEPA
ncbi:MAG: PAS domain S-box protein, partial [Proteobacteria bacterium]|nr:PAS domain S-box protein [Pseudomonadota bacterium]